MIVDSWVAKKIGCDDGEALTRASLERYQLKMLKTTLAYATERSSFYRKKYENINWLSDIQSVSDISLLPLMTTEELISENDNIICVSADEIDRIVTQTTAGTTGLPKRVFFTDDDQELMVDYIHNGLQVMINPNDVFLLLMPCEKPGSIGDLVRRGVERIGAKVISVGNIPLDESVDDEVIEIMKREGVTTGVATPQTGERLAKKTAIDTEIKSNMRTILLTAQYVSDACINTVETIWNCEVFEHYGMTEMGLGGAMACEIRKGYHPRENDLLIEIVDPASGEVLPDGEFGEIVFTTLTRKALPLIRYKTGDYSRWISSPCECGSVLKILDRVKDRDERKPY